MKFKIKDDKYVDAILFDGDNVKECQDFLEKSEYDDEFFMKIYSLFGQVNVCENQVIVRDGFGLTVWDRDQFDYYFDEIHF